RFRAAVETQKKAKDNSREYFAAGIIWAVCDLREAIKTKDARFAADSAYRVCENVYSMRIQAMEYAAVVGARTLSGGTNATNAKRKANRREQDERLLTRVDNKKKANPAETDASLARVASPRKPRTQYKRILRARQRAK